MPENHRLNQPGRFGTVPLVLTNNIGIGTGGINITASGTTDYLILPPGVRCTIAGTRPPRVAALTVAAGGGAITLSIVKRDTTAGADVTLTNSVSLTNSFLTAVNRSFALSWLSTLTDAQMTIQPNDILYARVVAASTVTTQPVQCHVAVEVFERE